MLNNINRKRKIYSKKTSFGRSDFPEGFLFGTASSAYQYEGAINEAPRGECVWDTFVRKYPGLYIDKKKNYQYIQVYIVNCDIHQTNYKKMKILQREIATLTRTKRSSSITTTRKISREWRILTWMLSDSLSLGLGFCLVSFLLIDHYFLDFSNNSLDLIIVFLFIFQKNSWKEKQRSEQRRNQIL